LTDVTLSAGTQLGPYRIANLLGVGGMGEVYRAHDHKLGRDVALKILPAAFRSDSERFARFEREARALAALNHPNIAMIHGLEEHDGIHALVLELVEGETLAEIIDGIAPTGGFAEQAAGAGRSVPRPIPVAQTLAIARQIADALEAAHERGIVHRDLKPANIKVTSDGLVKVLDFGLAKAMDAAASGSRGAQNLSHSPTMAVGATGTGVILGTASYMSPEQARGKAVDRRTDIWAFGCVLYEMLTCRVAFPGETLSDVLVSILDRVPDWSAVSSAVPPTVMRLLRRCLEKEARKRLRDIGDARLDLEEVLSAAEGAVAADTSRLPVRHVEFQRLTDVEGLKEAPAVSPDGKMVAFVALVAGKRQIWIRLLGGGAVLQLTRDDADHTHPRWAPDSSTLIYFIPAATESDAGTVWEIGALGGWPRRIATATGAADISHDGQRIAMLQSSEDQLALVVTSRDGSRGNRVVFLPGGSYANVRWAPDDGSIAYQRLAHGAFDGHLEVVSLATGERHEVARGTWLQGFAWLPDGSGFVYSSSRGSTMLYPPVFNLRAVRRDGRDDRQLTFGDHSYIEPDVHASGKLIAGRITSRSDIWKIPIGGSPRENTTNAVRITRQTGQVQVPSPSPDDREVVYVSDTGGHSNLWIARIDGSATRPITFETDPDAGIGVPAWSPRGDVIAFVRTELETAALWAVRPDGSGLRRMVQGWGPCWSADGRWLYYWRLGVEPGRVERVPADGGATESIREEEGLTLPATSPDGATLFVARPVQSKILGQFGTGFLEFARASPPDGPCQTMARVAGARLAARVWGIALSPDGRHLGTPLIDGATTNLWILPTAGGPMSPVTDFGERSVMITRNVSWSRDSQHIYAAVAETQTDVVLLDGLL
jgi:serine/threonine protein kinase/Tol biopolymer transport system component